MILDVANPSIIKDGDTVNIIVIVMGLVILLAIVGIIIYLMKRGKLSNEKK